MDSLERIWSLSEFLREDRREVLDLVPHLGPQREAYGSTVYLTSTWSGISATVILEHGTTLVSQIQLSASAPASFPSLGKLTGRYGMYTVPPRNPGGSLSVVFHYHDHRLPFAGRLLAEISPGDTPDHDTEPCRICFCVDPRLS